MEGDYPKHDVVIESEGGLGKVCKWARDGGDRSKVGKSHYYETRDHNAKIKDNILDCIGNTPMVRINNITKAEGIECEVLVKCEFLNPGGSVKDRIGRRMVLNAEKDGLIKPGAVLIEPTSGNTGVGLALAAAVKGYKMIVTLAEKMSQEKQDALTGLGSTVVRCPTEFGRDHLYGYLGVAFTLEKEMKQKGVNAFVPNQYKNTGNSMAHYNETGQEIYDQCDGNLDYCVIGVGTGGTVTGTSRKLKELLPNIKIVGVDPPGSVLSPPQFQVQVAPGGQIIEGTGYDFHPRNFDKLIVDDWISGPDKESFIMARRLLKEEGLMCGGSSGQAFYGAIEWIKKNKIPKGKRVVVILPDNIRNYMTKHLNADWMYEKGYMGEQECADCYTCDLIENKDWGQDKIVGDLPLHEARFIKTTDTCQFALNLMRETGFDQFPVKDEQNKTVGILTDKILLTRLSKRKVTPQDPIKSIMGKEFRQVSRTVKLNELSRVLTRNSYVLVEDKYFVHIQDVLDMIQPRNNKNEGQNEIKKQEAVKSDAEEQSKSCITSSLLLLSAGALIGAGVATLIKKLNK